MGRWLPRTVRHPLAGAYQAGHALQGDVRVLRLDADLRGNCRRPQGRRLEQTDYGWEVPALHEDAAGGCEPDRLPDRQDRQVGTRDVHLLLGSDAVRSPVQELEDVLRDGAARSHRLVLASHQLRLDAG